MPELRLDRGDGVELAYRLDGGDAAWPTLVFLPGLRSDMGGDKASALAAYAAAHRVRCLRLDYSGHGASGGRFEDGTIGRWAADVLLLIDRLSEGPVVLVGSSMGGWIALLVALARPERVVAVVGIAAAPDFTETHLWAALDEASRSRVLAEGAITLPSPYGAPLPITRALIEDGRTHLLLDRPIDVACPVRLLQGQRDDQVPWRTALRLAEQLAGSDVQVSLVKDGDHRLSRPADLALLLSIVASLLQAGSLPDSGFLGEDAA